MKIINKVAFIVHEPTMYAHYSKVWAEMGRDQFIIVLLGVFENEGKKENNGVTAFIENVNSLGYDYTYLGDLVRSKVKYKYVVSNHSIGGTSLTAISKKARVKFFVKQAINFLRKCVGAYALYANTDLYIPLRVGTKQIRFMYGADISDGWSLQPWNELYDLFLCHGPNDEAQLKKRFDGKTLVMGYP